MPFTDDEDASDELVNPADVFGIDQVKRFVTRRQLLKWGSVGALSVVGGGAGYYYYQQPPLLGFDGTFAYATPSHPPVVHAVVQFANELQGKPYVHGGGHSVLFDQGFDCSGSISNILFRAHLLDRPLTSATFAQYGAPGWGRYVSLFVKPGQHVFMAVCGLRFDTSGGQAGEGPRWRPVARDMSGFLIRHPVGV
jgi:hypothetical protein